MGYIIFKYDKIGVEKILSLDYTALIKIIKNIILAYFYIIICSYI